MGKGLGTSGLTHLWTRMMSYVQHLLSTAPFSVENGLLRLKTDNDKPILHVTTTAGGGWEHATDDQAIPTQEVVKTQLALKQGTISDLTEIRSGAGKGATALQPEDVKSELDPGGNGEIADSAAIAEYVGEAIAGKVDKSSQSIANDTAHTDTYDNTQGRRITIGTSSGTANVDVVPHSLVTGSITGTVATDRAMIPTAQAARNYADLKQQEVISRGENLVINGNGYMGDNTNFTSFTFDGVVTNNFPGSFRYSGKGSINSSYAFPVDPSQTYRFSVDVKSSSAATGSNFYIYLSMLDIDGNYISEVNHSYDARTATTLTQDLNNGDTVIHCADLSNWNIDATSSNNPRGVTFWNYTNSYGYTWPAFTYTRNTWNNLYSADSDVDTESNTITLSSAWNHGTIPAGTTITRRKAGRTYKYLWDGATSTEWKTVSGEISGVDYSGTNKNEMFVPGTAKCKAGFLLNYNGTDTTWITNVKVSALAGLDDLALKQDVLTFDTAPTAGSTNPVTSGGIAGALQAIASQKGMERAHLALIPLTFEAEEEGTFTHNGGQCEYSLDGGATWAELAAGGTTPTIAAGGTVQWRTRSSAYSANPVFASSGRFKVYGNIMSMYKGTDFAGVDKVTSSYWFRRSFTGCKGLTDAGNLIMPATSISYQCYYQMFYGCTSLTTAPELPATTLATYCYYQMFYGCTSLTYVKCLATGISASYALSNWLPSNGSGTFVKADETTWPRAASGIPAGWTVKNASDFDHVEQGQQSIVTTAGTEGETGGVMYNVVAGQTVTIGTSGGQQSGTFIPLSAVKGMTDGSSSENQWIPTWAGTEARYTRKGDLNTAIANYLKEFDFYKYSQTIVTSTGVAANYWYIQSGASYDLQPGETIVATTTSQATIAILDAHDAMTLYESGVVSCEYKNTTSSAITVNAGSNNSGVPITYTVYAPINNVLHAKT